MLETHEVSANQNRLVQAARSIALPIVHVLIQFSPDDREMGHEPYGSMKAVNDTGALGKDTWGS